VIKQSQYWSKVKDYGQKSPPYSPLVRLLLSRLARASAGRKISRRHRAACKIVRAARCHAGHTLPGTVVAVGRLRSSSPAPHPVLGLSGQTRAIRRAGRRPILVNSGQTEPFTGKAGFVAVSRRDHCWHCPLAMRCSTDAGLTIIPGVIGEPLALLNGSLAVLDIFAAIAIEGVIAAWPQKAIYWDDGYSFRKGRMVATVRDCR